MYVRVNLIADLAAVYRKENGYLLEATITKLLR
ncbi:hypothetical protein Lepto7375DRAFT_0976 [Leptolyngbya sp. PCC 7375]|nr:hypothetical protein Lepto7375DRAFT_0976 [Leptolyngbya sp. PCC 7375]